MEYSGAFYADTNKQSKYGCTTGVQNYAYFDLSYGNNMYTDTNVLRVDSLEIFYYIKY